jgi:hypothetical protein
VGDFQAQIEDLKAALQIAQGEHGKNWGSQRRVKMRTDPD